MQKFNVEIFLPIFPDTIYEKYPFEQTPLVLDEIEGILKSVDFTTTGYITGTKITGRILRDVPEETLRGILEERLALKMDILNFSFEAEVNITNYIVVFQKWNSHQITNESDALEILPYSLSRLFGDKVFELIVLSQIARPASLKLAKGAVWVDKQKLAEVKTFGRLHREAFDCFNEKGYPQIDFFDFPHFYTWIDANNLMFTEHPENSYQKAINNITHLTNDTNEITRLVYQMMTLEQLYTSSKLQITEQLNAKIQVYLGEITSYKKQIKTMYDIRSRFFHGELPSLPSHKAFQFEEYPSIQQDLIDAENLSLLLIISTLQKMHKDNILDLRFEYNLAAHK